MLLLAVALSFLFALTWVVMMTLTLSPTDMAYGQAPFEDPLVFPIMSMFAGVAACFTYPFLYFALRDRPFPKAPAILAGIVMAEILLVTPFYASLSFLGSFVAYFVGLVVARENTVPMFRPGYCRACGYDLRGTTEGRACPECGKPVPITHKPSSTL